MSTMYDTMKELNIKVCPFCGKEYTDHPAISRRDNKTEICPMCGTMESLEDYMNDTLVGKENDERYCIFEKKLCRFARRKDNSFKCVAPNDLSMLCNK